MDRQPLGRIRAEIGSDSQLTLGTRMGARVLRGSLALGFSRRQMHDAVSASGENRDERA